MPFKSFPHRLAILIFALFLASFLYPFLTFPSLTPSPFLGSAFGAVSNIDMSIALEERKRRDLDKRIEKYHQEIKEKDSKVRSLLSQIDALQQDESIAGQELAVLELQQQKLQEDMSFLNAEMAREQSNIDELLARMQGRLLDMYKYGASEEMNLLFASANVFEAIEAVHLLKIIARHDESLLSQLQERYQTMELSRKVANNKRAELKKESEAVRAKREDHKNKIRQTNAFIGRVQRERSLALKASKEAEDAQKAVGQHILTLQRRKREQPEAAARQARQARGGGRVPRAGSGVDYLAGRGRGSMFDWPIRGDISSPYGQRIHPIFKTQSMHSGMDIVAPAGSAVKAAAGGEVLFDGWLRGYGQVVILDHGRNYSTVYAHLSSTSVKEGQVVKPGTVVGRVGKTGTATGYHLHFEVRIGSTVKNPLDYLKR